MAYHGANSVCLMSVLNYNETDPFPPQPPRYLLIMSASDFGFAQTERVIQLGLKYSF